MIFLGTGAAELLPSAFCTCRICENARTSNDAREKRRRSALLLNSENLIDFGPDVPYACAQYGCSLVNLKNIFLTHSHSDHCSFHTLFGLKTAVNEPPHIKIFMSDFAYNKISNLEDYARKAGYDVDKHKKYLSEYCELVPLYFAQEKKVDDFTVTPLKTIHPAEFIGEHGFNYVFEKPGKTILYASDTGLYPEENYEILQSKKIDTLILEGTRGIGDFSITDRHLTFEAIKIIVNRLTGIGSVSDSTRIFITHISHRALLTHSEYDKLVKKELGSNASVAYDGLDVPNVF